jgi:hypothetical protein
MNCENQVPASGDRQTDHRAVERKPYTTPTVESLGGTLATLLASGCSPCSICPPDPGADQP